MILFRTILALALFWISSPAHSSDIQPSEPERYALIISASHYQNFPFLDNSINDGNAISATLQSYNFNLIRVVSDPQNIEQIQFEITAIRNQIGNKPALLFVYFSGHGYEDDVNYIVPTMARNFHYLEGDSYAVPSIVNSLASSSGGMTIVIIDACRGEGPTVAGSPKPRVAVYTSTRVVLGLSTKAGDASRNVSRFNKSQSPYSVALERQLGRAERSIGKALQLANNEVFNDTDPPQQEAELHEGIGHSLNLYLRPSQALIKKQINLLKQILNEDNSKECLISFMDRYPASMFTKFANDLLFASTSTSVPSGKCREILDSNES